MKKMNDSFIFADTLAKNVEPMEFRHLKTFQAITDAGSFSAAAKKLQYAQSTITLHIQQLEAELKVQLFYRQGKCVKLTTAGRALQEHSKQLLNRATALQKTMSDLVLGEAGHLRIACIEPIASISLPTILVEFCRKYPKVRLTLEVGVTRTICQQVSTGKVDLAICSSPPALMGLSFDSLFLDPLILLLPQDHRLVDKKEILVQDLAEERILLTDQNCPYREMLETAFFSYGINPYSGIDIISMEAIKRMIAGGLGIGLVSSAFKESLPDKIIVRNIENLELCLSVGIVYEPEMTIPGRALDLFIDMLKSDLWVP
jgi:LysR family transcriptional regulator, regulator of the ytmI operon